MEFDILMNDINVNALGSAVIGIILSAMTIPFTNASKKLIKFLSLSVVIFISGTIGGTMGIIFLVMVGILALNFYKMPLAVVYPQ